MNFELKNGSTIESLQDTCGWKGDRSKHICFLQSLVPEVFVDLKLKWYQKIYIKIIHKMFNLKKIKTTIRVRKCSCLNCGKKIKPSILYVPSRGCGKPFIEMARMLRTLCCSNRCFYDYWIKLWNRGE